MIGGLQGDFGNLDIKYLKQNIPGDLKMSVANIRKLQENIAVVQHSAFSLEWSGYGWSRKLKRLLSHPDMSAGWSWNASFPIRILNFGCHLGVDAAPDVSGGSRIPDVIHPDGYGGSRMEFLPGWKWAGCSCLAKAISSSFKLQFVHRLKRWILDFLSFEMVYRM